MSQRKFDDALKNIQQNIYDENIIDSNKTTNA
jgi:hypothetical protein